MKRTDLTNKRFGRLTALECESRKIWSGKSRPYWKCRCDCGTVKFVSANCLMMNATKSCGCLCVDLMRNNQYRLTHGETRTRKLPRLYRTWSSMRNRCSNRKGKNWKDYGGRGIKVSPEWDDFSAFKSWSLTHGFDPSLSLDRIDVNGDYSPENCRWATQQQQMENRRTFGLIEVFSNEELISECKKRGILK